MPVAAAGPGPAAALELLPDAGPLLLPAVASAVLLVAAAAALPALPAAGSTTRLLRRRPRTTTETVTARTPLAHYWFLRHQLQARRDQVPWPAAGLRSIR